MPFAPPTRDQELEALRSQADWLKDQMDAITKRVAELDQQKS
jgi:prefoldin subunit 5